MSEKKKTRALDILEQVNSVKGGIDGLMVMDGTNVQKIPRSPTGLVSLDIILGGGWPHGRIIELMGLPSGGKSSIAMASIAEAQKRGAVAAYIDSEHAFSMEYAHTMGLDLDSLLFFQPNTGEEAFEAGLAVAKNMEAGDILVFDSVAAMVPKAELEGNMDDLTMGALARLMAKGLSKLVQVASERKIIVIFVNQIRDKLNVTFGKKETTPGGRALKFYSSIRLDVRRVQAIKASSGDDLGNVVKLKTEKNKTFPPFKTCKVDLIFGEGFDQINDLISCAIPAQVLLKEGNTISYEGTKLGVGMKNATKKLKEDPEMVEEIKERCQEYYFGESTGESDN